MRRGFYHAFPVAVPAKNTSRAADIIVLLRKMAFWENRVRFFTLAAESLYLILSDLLMYIASLPVILKGSHLYTECSHLYVEGLHPYAEGSHLYGHDLHSHAEGLKMYAQSLHEYADL
jgi:hypothetical protein